MNCRVGMTADVEERKSMIRERKFVTQNQTNDL